MTTEMVRAARRIGPALAVLGLVAGAVGQARAGIVVATLSANPDPINEGGSTSLTLSLQDTPYTGGSYTGYGYISGFLGSFNPGNGQGPVPASGAGGGSTAGASTSITYPLPGDYTASFTGSVNSVDQYSYNYYEYSYPVYGYDSFGHQYIAYYVPVYGTGYGFNSSVTSINASTGIHVNDVDPTITQLTWAPDVLTGQDFNFSVTATDPGLAGGERLTIAYDFAGTGQFSDFVVSGVTTDAGTYHFDQAGIYHVNVLVTDNYGGSTMGSFDVTVRDPITPDVAAPEPSTLVGAATAIPLGRWLRRRRSVAA